MLLILSSKTDTTVDYFLSKLKLCESLYRRINTEDLFLKSNITINYQTGHINHVFDGRAIKYDQIKSIWYRRPEPITLSENLDIDPHEAVFIKRENEKLWGGIFESLSSATWVNHPLANTRANYKPEQLFRAKRIGLNIPKTVITDSRDEAVTFLSECNGSIVVKPISFGYIERSLPAEDSIVYTNVLHQIPEDVLNKIGCNPTLFQEFIEKTIDIRINYINNKLIAFAIHSQEIEENKIDFRRNNSMGLRYSLYELPEVIESQLKKLVSSYGLEFAAIDMVVDNSGLFYFLEINPNGQWAWLEEETGVKLSEELLQSFKVLT